MRDCSTLCDHFAANKSFLQSRLLWQEPSSAGGPARPGSFDADFGLKLQTTGDTLRSDSSFEPGRAPTWFLMGRKLLIREETEDRVW